MLNYNSTLQSNNIDLQAILDSINELPDAGGIELPELTNEGAASDLLSGKQLIDSEGNIVTGTFTIDDELSTIDNLVAQIQTALEGKASSGGDDGDGKIGYFTVNNQTSLDLIIKGIICPFGDNTEIPYDIERDCGVLVFAILEPIDYPISCSYIELIENEDGEIYEEPISSTAYPHTSEFSYETLSVCFFTPGPQVVDNMITFYTEY